MTKFPYDEFAKGFLETLLSPFGTVEPSYKIAAEVREVDVYFMPSGDNLDCTDLGLLGKCATYCSSCHRAISEFGFGAPN